MAQNSQVTEIIDLCEYDTFDPKDVLDELFEYLSDDRRLDFVFHLHRELDIDLNNWSILDRVDPMLILEEATNYFTDSFQRGFINKFYELY